MGQLYREHACSYKEKTRQTKFVAQMRSVDIQRWETHFELEWLVNSILELIVINPQIHGI